MKKKMPDRKTLSPAYRLEDVEECLRKLENEDGMIDDHGQAIIGRRDRQPVNSLSEVGVDLPEKKCSRHR
jgi:hypothetical protein